jgi:hypothetical protein
MMKSILFSLISVFALIVPTFSNSEKICSTFDGLCSLSIVDRCYDCVYIGEEKKNDVCVPIFHKQLGTLDIFPQDSWNCTIFRKEEITKGENIIDKIVNDICDLDSIIVDVCNHENKDGLCMISDYINDLCNSQNKGFQLNNNMLGYISPWGSKSQCVIPDYKEICSDSVTKSCFDCRIITYKLGPVISYYHQCFALMYSENENELVTRLKKDKYECKKFINPKFKPAGEKKLYPACSGGICKKEGWTFEKSMFGRDWCGLGTCQIIGNRFFCNFPINCGK